MFAEFVTKTKADGSIVIDKDRSFLALIEALENMKQTVNTLTTEVDKAQKYLDKSNQTTVLEVSKELNMKKITNQSNTVDIDI